MNLGLASLMIGLATPGQPFEGGFVDMVGSEASMRLARLILGGPNGLPTDVLPIQVCKDDCVRVILEDAAVLSGSLTFRISMTETVRDEVVRSIEIAGECPAIDFDRCADDARAQMGAFASRDGTAL